MPRLRSSRYLTCFYCGTRSNCSFDGITRDFLCLYCDARNYLDENGEITDPPVATEREEPARYFAVQRASSPPSSQPQDSIFCSTCLKNQRLFTASLAQYLPDDPSHPEYPELERNYYRYRKSLEARYPQVCEECAEKVEGRIRQAGYTAKTDHLRRMMEKSRGRRVETTKTTGADWADTLGRGLWWGGWLMQALWHLRAVAMVLRQSDQGMYDPDDKSCSALAISGLVWIVAFLPPPDKLISGAIMASILSVWWNPRFVQVSRGFSRHLLGFTQWYSFQGLVIFFRYLFRGVLEMDGGMGQSRSAQLSAHFGVAAIMGVIFSMARKSIRVDTTPLFGTDTPTLSPKPKHLAKRKQEDAKTFSDLLSEALDSPSTTPVKGPLSRQPVSSLPPPYPPSIPLRTQESPRMGLNSLNISPQASQGPMIEYSDEMDWTPTQVQSRHRALADPAPNRSTKFGEAPVHPDSPFWYKVPAAPTNPAQRLRNPPNAPVLRSKPAQKENVFFTSKSQSQRDERRDDESAVTFKQPSFFAPSQDNDDANSLADMLGQSFSLSQEPETPQGSKAGTFWTRRGSQSTIQVNVRGPRAVEAAVLVILTAVWLLTVSVSVPFGREFRLAVLSAAGTIALRVTGDTNKDMKEEPVPSTATYVGSVLSVVELASVCWLGWETWKGEMDVGRYGIGVLFAMLTHQVWNTIL